MTTSDMVRELCKKQNISIAELCRRIGQSPQNFNKKLNRVTLSSEEMIAIADALEVIYEQTFVLKNGETIQIGNEEQTYEK
jgi:transcriptional regulator with XRE-family HTH domain